MLVEEGRQNRRKGGGKRRHAHLRVLVNLHGELDFMCIILVFIKAWPFI